jgi:hypothetical protein
MTSKRLHTAVTVVTGTDVFELANLIKNGLLGVTQRYSKLKNKPFVSDN